MYVPYHVHPFITHIPVGSKRSVFEVSSCDERIRVTERICTCINVGIYVRLP